MVSYLIILGIVATFSIGVDYAFGTHQEEPVFVPIPGYSFPIEDNFTTTPIEPGKELYENEKLNVSFIIPEAWSLQHAPKYENNPDVAVVGSSLGQTHPVVSLRIFEKNGKSLDDFIKIKNELLNQLVAGTLEITSQEKSTINGKEAYVIHAKAIFQSYNQTFHLQFIETTISGPDKFYALLYSNGVDDFDNRLSRFDDAVNSFMILPESSLAENILSEGTEIEDDVVEKGKEIGQSAVEKEAEIDETIGDQVSIQMDEESIQMVEEFAQMAVASIQADEESLQNLTSILPYLGITIVGIVGGIIVIKIRNRGKDNELSENYEYYDDEEKGLTPRSKPIEQKFQEMQAGYQLGTANDIEPEQIIENKLRIISKLQEYKIGDNHMLEQIKQSLIADGSFTQEATDYLETKYEEYKKIKKKKSDE